MFSLGHPSLSAWVSAGALTTNGRNSVGKNAVIFMGAMDTAFLV
jgi:hypothetical protein